MKLHQIALLAVLAGGLMSQSAFAQATDSDSQLFRLVVSSSVSITAPQPLVTDTHSGADGDFAFLPQLWNVNGNVATGVTVDFTVDAPFTHTTAGDLIDAQITVSAPINVVGTPGWTVVGSNVAATDHAGSTNTATVSYTSSAPGGGDFAVSVDFQGGAFGSFLAGTYETTVTGTVTENP